MRFFFFKNGIKERVDLEKKKKESVDLETISFWLERIS